MKKRPVLLTLIILIATMLLSMSVAFGASASLSISGGGTYNVGDTVRITFTLSGTNIAQATAQISYDSSVLQYTGGSGATLPSSASGVLRAQIGDGSAHSSMSVTLNFKALKAGSSSVSISPTDVIDYEFNSMSCSAKSTTVTVKNSSSSASGNANLSSLRISAGSLSPAFSPKTTSYTVNVGNSVTTCTMSVSTADSNATYTISGSSSLSVGQNTRKIVVTAQNGTTKTYTINIYRAAADSGSENTDSDDENKDDDKEQRPEEIKVTVGEKEYIVVEDFEGKDIPQGFAMTVAKFGDYEIPVFSDKDLKYTLALLKDGETGDESWFFYDEETDEFSATTALTAEEIIAYEEAADDSSAHNGEEKEDVKTDTILYIALGVTGAALLAVIIALQVKIIRKREKQIED